MVKTERELKLIREMSEMFLSCAADIPFDIMPRSLYTAESLYDRYVIGRPETLADCYDTKASEEYHRQLKESLDGKADKFACEIHDYFISNNLVKELSVFDRDLVVGFMGGHAVKRDDREYCEAAVLGKMLSEKGYIVLTGGGPGVMEAGNLGASMAGYPEEALQDALDILSEAPDTKNGPAWLDAALKVRMKYPVLSGVATIGVPTWKYSEEPNNIFATGIAKYFDDSVRETALLRESYGGIVVFKGGAGTIMEIFKKCEDNNYRTYGDPSPLVLKGRVFWQDTIEIDRFIRNTMRNKVINGSMMNIVDTVEEAFSIICDYPELHRLMSPEGKEDLWN